MNENEEKKEQNSAYAYAMAQLQPDTPEETEALRAMRESYEAQLAALRQEQAKAREEHAKQIREILLSGGNKRSEKGPTADEEEETEEEHVARAAREIADKILKR